MPVAVKLLKTEVPSLLDNIDFETVNELEMEAKLLRSLRHRNIVMYHGTGELKRKATQQLTLFSTRVPKFNARRQLPLRTTRPAGIKDDKLILVTEFVPKGSLREVLDKPEVFRWRGVGSWMRVLSRYCKFIFTNCPPHRRCLNAVCAGE